MCSTLPQRIRNTDREHGVLGIAVPPACLDNRARMRKQPVHLGHAPRPRSGRVVGAQSVLQRRRHRIQQCLQTRVHLSGHRMHIRRRRRPRTDNADVAVANRRDSRLRLGNLGQQILNSLTVGPFHRWVPRRRAATGVVCGRFCNVLGIHGEPRLSDMAVDTGKTVDPVVLNGCFDVLANARRKQEHNPVAMPVMRGKEPVVGKHQCTRLAAAVVVMEYLAPRTHTFWGPCPERRRVLGAVDAASIAAHEGLKGIVDVVAVVIEINKRDHGPCGAAPSVGVVEIGAEGPAPDLQHRPRERIERKECAVEELGVLFEEVFSV
eukprot:m.212823 g.212823  ORF g.212823 m.212823 type:complete len:321 (+) comp19051_c0_seq5:137-1099(+)